MKVSFDFYTTISNINDDGKEYRGVRKVDFTVKSVSKISRVFFVIFFQLFQNNGCLMRNNPHPV